MKRSWKSQVFFVAALLAVVALLAACSIQLPGIPGGPATKAPTPMPPSAKQVPAPTQPSAPTQVAAPTQAPAATKAPVAPAPAATAAVTTTTGAAMTGTLSAVTAVPLEGTRWKMVSYLDSKGQTVQALAGTEVTALFQNGQVSGTDGCNQYGGSYKTSENVLTVKLGPSTMMACDPRIMDQGKGYTAALASSATYKITGKQLEITNGGGKVALTYTVLESTPLAGTTWKATGVNNGKGGVQSIAAGTEITAIFGADGTVAGSAGCNNYATTYQVVTSTIKISPAIAATRKMCPEPAMQQEAAYLAALPTAATYRIESNKLELRDAKGALQVSYTAATPPPAAGQAPAVGAAQMPTKTLTITATAATTATVPLAGTNWKLASLQSAQGGAFPPLPGTEITALFQGGKVTGSAGCNNYSATYKTGDADKLTISATAATTRKACPAPTMQQETAYLAALAKTATYKIEGEKLELRNAAGDLLASYAAPKPAAPPAAAAPVVPAVKAPSPTPAPAAAPTKAPAPAVAPTAAPAKGATQLTNTLWKWVRFIDPVEASDVPNPDKYTVVFRTDGKVEITADCNKVGGTYKAVGSRIQIQLGPSTMAACPPGSLSDQFIKNLGFATLYFMEDGYLYLEMFADSGVMKFANGGAAK